MKLWNGFSNESPELIGFNKAAIIDETAAMVLTLRCWPIKAKAEIGSTMDGT